MRLTSILLISANLAGKLIGGLVRQLDWRESMRKMCIFGCGFGIGFVLYASLSFGQVAPAPWQQEVRTYTEKQDWVSAMRLVESEMARSPQDMDVRAWRARILTWSGRLDEAEQEYLQIIAIVPNDPDNWMGLAAVYSRQNRLQDALQSLDGAIALDPKRADLHLARGRALRALNRDPEAKAEFKAVLALNSDDKEARAGIAPLKVQPKHLLLLGTNANLFSFADADQQEAINLISRWSTHWETSFGGSFYRWVGVDAQKLNASVAVKSVRLGSFTLGGALAHDGGVIPRNEAFYAYDRAWRLAHGGFLRGLETNFEQHWYWYSSARVITLHETTTAYFPRDWTWSLRLIGAFSRFSANGAEWRPAGFSKIAFPLKNFENRQIAGNIFFATGTEDYAQVNQIGHFSSHTYGGGLHFQIHPAQDIGGFAGYETRTQGLNQVNFGLTYGIRF
jgi:tetratricopeptide (TPR) repeat protein